MAINNHDIALEIMREFEDLLPIELYVIQQRFLRPIG